MKHGFVRKILKCKKDESITNNLRRKKVTIEKQLYKKPISREALKGALMEMGLGRGDSVIVHCAWREFYNYTSTPNSAIDIIIDIIGKDANLAMPCYGADEKIFDLKTTPSAAGVLSEVFRKEYEVIRSSCSHFSMVVMGPDAKELTCSQISSRSGFDDLATYSKMLSIPGCKVLFLGLGKYPLQITQMHVEEYRRMDEYIWCKNLFTEKYESVLLNTPTDGQQLKRIMIKRKGGRPNKKNRCRIYKQLQNYKHIKLSNIDMVLVNADDTKNSIDKCIDEKRMFSK